MPRIILDSSILIWHWRKQRSRLKKSPTLETARRWAQTLQELYAFPHESQALVGIVTPVYLEVVGGARDQTELKLFRVYLNVFPRLDQERLIREDWEQAE